MKNIYIIVKFKLNNENLIEDWKKISAEITENISKSEGFISRDSAVDKEGNVYCIVKWESLDHQQAFEKHFHEIYLKKNPKMMEEFMRIGNGETMTKEVLEIL